MVAGRNGLIAAARRHPVRLVLAAAVLAAAAGAVGWYLRDRQRVRLGREALQRHDFAAALANFEAYLNHHSDDPDLHLLAAQAARRGGNLKAAEEHLFACQRLGNVSDTSTLEWAMLKAQGGDTASVETYLRDKQARDPAASSLVLEAVAQGALKKGNLPLALEALDRLLKLQPDHYQGRFLRGRLWHDLDRFESAQADLARAIELRPDAIETRLLLADGAYRLGHVAEAAAHYERALRQRPDDFVARLGLARCRVDSHDLDEAGRMLDALLVEKPHNATALIEQGRLLLRRGQAEVAEKSLRHAVAADPQQRDGYVVLQLALEAQGKSAEARSCLQQRLQLEAEARRRRPARAELAQDTP